MFLIRSHPSIGISHKTFEIAYDTADVRENGGFWNAPAWPYFAMSLKVLKNITFKAISSLRFSPFINPASDFG